MRSWENREDTEVWDEPLYAYYLSRTGLPHPGREAIMAAGECDWAKVIRRCKHRTHKRRQRIFSKTHGPPPAT